jgi:glycosyltransferase involved in cell wall biosynthesis
MRGAMPLVSVIIPAYNYGRFIGDALDSLQSQTLSDWECFVVDDGSTDNTGDIVCERIRRDGRIYYLRHKNAGLSASRNAGLLPARGEYVQFLDADDLLEPDKLRAQVDFLERDDGSDIVYGPARYFRDGHPNERRFSLFDPDEPWMPETSGEGRELLQPLIRRCLWPVNAPLIRREIFKEVGEFNTSLCRYEDWEFWIRCAVAGCRFDFLDAPNVTALIRVHRASISQNTSRDREEMRAFRAAVGNALS